MLKVESISAPKKDNRRIEPLLEDIDLLILDNLSTLLTEPQ